MHIIIHPSQWQSRMQALNLKTPDLARLAGLSHGTLYRGFERGGRFEQTTIEAVSEALLREEQRLRDVLKGTAA